MIAVSELNVGASLVYNLVVFIRSVREKLFRIEQADDATNRSLSLVMLGCQQD